MKNANDVCVIIQARLGSKRIPHKMIKPICGTTLMDICLKKLSDSECIPNKNIYISVFEQELIEIVEKYDVNHFFRSAEPVPLAVQ